MSQKNSPYTIFIVEDDPWYGEKLEYQLSMNPDFNVVRFETADMLLQNLHQKPQLITVDFSMPGMQGDELFKEIHKRDSEIPVIVISSQDQIPVAVQLLKLGVSDYIVKDDNTRDLLFNSINRIRENQSLKKEVAELKKVIDNRDRIERTIVGQSERLKSVFALIDKAAASDINISITGETGTGKEIVARAIHDNSDRNTHNFVALNMAAIPDELVESELFGHEKGSFTGAFARKIGKFEEANGGTIFLDEIAEMGLGNQSKILRVLQERELVRVGGSDSITLDVRVIVSTHKNLADEVENGNFREDLYYRVMGLPINLPPLRDRGNDIVLLAQHFIDLYAKRVKSGPYRFTKEAMDKLLAYKYPGNVRELEAVINLAVVLCENHEIQAQDIVFSSPSNLQFTGGNKTLKQHNREIISHYLKVHDNSVPKVAEILDIGKSTIYTMIKAGEINI